MRAAKRPARGSVWTAELSPTVGHEQAGRRPCLVVSSDAFNGSPAGLVTVLPITSRERRMASRIPLLPPEGGLSVASWVITEQVRTVSTERLGRRLGSVHPETLAAVSDALRLLLGLE